MKYSITVFPVSVGKDVRRIPHSPNTLNSMHWAVKGRWKKAWQERVCWEIKANKIPKLKKPTITLTIHSIVPMDIDNAYSSCKGLIDGIVDSGIIEDDSNEYCTIKLEQVKVKHRVDEKVVIAFE